MELLITVGVVALFLGFGAFMVIRDRRIRGKDSDLLASFVLASATVVRLRPDAESGEDDLYVLSIELVVPPGLPRAGERMPVELRSFLGAHVMPALQPGSSISIRVDPRDSTRAALDLAAMKLA